MFWRPTNRRPDTTNARTNKDSRIRNEAASGKDILRNCTAKYLNRIRMDDELRQVQNKLKTAKESIRIDYKTPWKSGQGFTRLYGPGQPIHDAQKHMRSRILMGKVR